MTDKIQMLSVFTDTVAYEQHMETCSVIVYACTTEHRAKGGSPFFNTKEERKKNYMSTYDEFNYNFLIRK